MLYLLFLATISCLAGFLGGLTGTGGIIMPPLMIEFYGVDPHLAMGLAQASYVLPSLFAVLLFIQKGQFDWRVALPMAIPGCVCSFFAAGYLKPRIGGASLTMLFAICIAVSGLVMLRRSTRMLARPLSPPWRAPVLALLGCAVGVMSGVTGSGGNAVLVPVMIFFGLEVLSVLAACQFFSVLASGSGALGNALNMHLDLLQLACLIVSQMVGIRLGVGLAQRTDTARLKRYVGVICLLAGVFIMARTLAAM